MGGNMEMKQPPELWDICSDHHGGNRFSVSANATTDKHKDRALIMAYLDTVQDSTCDQCEVALGMSHQTCSARFSEMKMLGMIEPTAKRPTRTGCMAMAWRSNTERL